MNEFQPPDDLSDEQEEAQYMALLENCPEECPACGSKDLHTASLGGEAAMSCCDCTWIATIASFQPEE
jgi:hypothetical protein